MRDMTWLWATGVELEAMTAHHGDSRALWMREGRKLHNGFDRAFFAARKVEVVNRWYTVCIGFLITIIPEGGSKRK